MEMNGNQWLLGAVGKKKVSKNEHKIVVKELKLV